MPKTLAQKLTIAAGDVVFMQGVGKAHPAALVDLPDGAAAGPAADATVALLGIRDGADLAELLAGTLPDLVDVRAVWILYPKGNASDVNRDTIWATVADHGWRLVSNVSVDTVWSAVRARLA